MRVIAFVGPSGTGKSHRAAFVAQKNGADENIDDCLLISKSSVLAGISAKKAPTRLASVRQALFSDTKMAEEVSLAIKKLSPKCIMILGTSDGMTERIAKALGLPSVEHTIYIDEVATYEEMNLAKNIRSLEGKHVIPVPELEVKKDFSGYFMHPLRFLQKSLGDEEAFTAEKTIVRPTFSYLGDFTISDKVVIDAVRHEALREPSVYKVNNVNIRTTNHGAHIDVTLILRYGGDIKSSCKEIQRHIREGIEKNTSINVRRVHILVKSLYCEK